MNISRRIYGLDILRGLAILLVIYEHSFRFFDVPYFRLVDGVSIFFVLSGFLIGKILLEKIDRTDFSMSDLFNFWVRRWLRTLPAYFFVLTILVIGSIYSGSQLGWFDYARFYLFIQNFFFARRDLYKEAWSLSIEEWFYLLVPILFFLSFKIARFKRQKIVLFWIVLILSGVSFWRNYSIYVHGYTDYRQWNLYARCTVVTRLDSIMYGVLAAWLNHHNIILWKYKNFLFALGCGLFLLIIAAFHSMAFSWPYVYLVISLESIATFLVIPKLSSIQTGKGYLFRALTFTSMISYSMYLLNFTPFYLLTNGLSIDKHVLFVLNLTWDFGGAYLLYRVIERPFMHLRDKLTLFKKKRHAGFLSA